MLSFIELVKEYWKRHFLWEIERGVTLFELTEWASPYVVFFYRIYRELFDEARN